jgi:hypothetical protein
MARSRGAAVVVAVMFALVLAACRGRGSHDTTPPRDARVEREPPIAPTDAAPKLTKATKLRKADVGLAIKTIIPRLTPCYERVHARDPQLAGVINTRLSVHNEPTVALRVRVTGFDTRGTLGRSQPFLDCVKTTFESAELPPLDTRGSLELTYPTTFAPQPPDNRDAAIVDEAEQAAREQRWTDALRNAEHGLELTTLDGTYRRRLIEVAGLAACHLKDEPTARDYYRLAPPHAEPALEQACMQHAKIDLTR